MAQEESRPADHRTAPNAAPDSPKDSAVRHDEFANLRRRRGAAVRLEGVNPDPVYPGRQFHRPSTGLRADGYRQGYAAALRYVLREFGDCLNEIGRAKLIAIVKRSETTEVVR